MCNYITGDFWKVWKAYDVALITTNGYIKKSGEGVMGAGIAKQAKDKYPVLPKRLGTRIRENGNIVQSIAKMVFKDGSRVILGAFPVKHSWDERADESLIEESCKQLMHVLNDKFPDNAKVLLNYPGIGNGKLKREQVKPILDKYLDERVTIISYK